MSTRKFIDAYWVVNNRGMGRYAQIYSALENAKLDYPYFNNISNKIIKYIYYILWEQIFFQLKHALITNKELIFAYNTPPIIKIGNYQCTLVIHDLIFMNSHAKGEKIASRFLSQYRRFALSRGIRNVDKLIFVSNSTKNLFFDQFHVNISFEIIPNMVVIEKSITNPKLVRINKRNLNLLFVTGNSCNKNPKGLYELLQRIEKENSQVDRKIHSHIIGLNKNSLGMSSPNITLYTNCSEEVKNTLYQNVDFFISISLQEGFGIPIIEAGINRTPIICSDIPIYREICSENALFINPSSIIDIYKLLESLKHLDNTDLKEKVDKNKEAMYIECLQKYCLCAIA